MLKLSPLGQRRWQNFTANKRGFYSLWIFIVLLAFSLLADVIANDKPLVVSYDGGLYFPVLKKYPETTFGGEFQTEADYRDIAPPLSALARAPEPEPAPKTKAKKK